MEEQGGYAREGSFKRKLIEVANAAKVNNGNGNEVGGEMRRIHIVYFLCHFNGRLQQPHLIRIHHFSRNGVHLTDVKRWLSELRGKEMPERFAWSYKRRYKEGYVWQDLLNEDLITPISDNEYVLKGSEIFSRTLDSGKEAFMLKTSPPLEGNPKYSSMRKEYAQDFSTNTSIEIGESSFGSNVTTQDTPKNQDVHKDKEVLQPQEDKQEHNSFDQTTSNDHNNICNNNKSKKSGDIDIDIDRSPSYSFKKRGRKTRMFRNWITCGTANANEKALVVIDKRNGSLVYEKNGKENKMGQICKEQKLRGYEKRFGPYDEPKKSKKEEPKSFKTFGAAYKPVNGPNCSQCGKQFKPEKLHSHMKYCKGMKAMAKSTNSSLKPKTTRTHSPSSVSIDTFFLTND